METVKTFNQMVLGGYNFGQFLGFTFWALIGAYLLMQFKANKRDVISSRTPVEWSWRFFIFDNLRRITFNLVMILVVIRFSVDITGREINEFWALVIGLSSDGLALLLSHFNLLNLTKTSRTPGNTPDFRREVTETKTQGTEAGNTELNGKEGGL